MASIPYDMLFYYETSDGIFHYFSAYYSTKKKTTSIVEVDSDELWGLVKEFELDLDVIPPDKFEHPTPDNILGNVHAFLIKPKNQSPG